MLLIKLHLFQMSSSESDFLSSDEEFEVFHREKRQKNENYFEYVVPHYSETEFLEHFRVRRHVAEQLSEYFRDSRHYSYQAGGNGKLLPLQHILIFLWFAGHEAASFRDVADRFNICISSLRHVIERVTKFVSELGADIIKWPSVEERAHIEANFRGNGMPGAIGAIDGTHIRIDKPTKAVSCSSYYGSYPNDLCSLYKTLLILASKPYPTTALHWLWDAGVM